MTPSIKKQVDLLFKQQGHFQVGDLRENPVTRGHWVHGIDPEGAQKRIAARALAAQEWFARTGPTDAPPLPLGFRECSEMRRGGLPHLVALYAHSIINNGYDTTGLPSFDAFASGVLAMNSGMHRL